ncbi:MAG: acyltransferase family protein [Vibrio sp.]
MLFRKDINGLRAVAILAVLLFHFQPNLIQGGFVGVDVFFVISGFLMTSIIFRGLENNDFSILKFYIARANRIIPALAVLCFVLIVFGYLALNELDMRALTKHIASSLGFLSNLVYWNESGYFDAASKEKWLLHTWSLSVEWQFYIVYPLILVILSKFLSLKSLKLTVLFGFVAGLFVSIFLTYRSPSLAYYFFPARAWEMMLGGLAYLYPVNISETKRKFSEYAGLILILLSCFLLSEKQLWPGYLALLPTIGAYLIIQAQKNDGLIASSNILQFLGRSSYSIYLWHWPFVVAIYHFSLASFYVYLGIVASIICGYLSYRFIESFKFNREFPSLISYLGCKPIWMVCILGVMSSAMFINYTRLLHQIPDEYYQMASYETGYCFGSGGPGKSDQKFLNCYLGNKDKSTDILLYGDSFAGHYEPMIDEAGKKLDLSIQSVTTNSCYPSLTKNFHHDQYHVGYQQCMLDRAYVRENISKFKYIFVSTRWDEFLEGFQNTADEVDDWIDFAISKGVTVVYLPNPDVYQKNVSNEYISSLMGHYDLPKDMKLNDTSVNYTRSIEQHLKQKYANNDHFVYIDREKLFTGNTFEYKGENVAYYSDDGHLSTFASKNLADKFIATGVFQSVMKK